MRERVTEFIICVLRELFGWPVIKAKQNVAVKFPQYIVVDMLSERSLGDCEVWDTDKEEIHISALREATVNVQAYGNGSVELLAELWGNLERPMVVDEFFKANIAVTTTGDVQDLTELMDNRAYQERASIDLTVSFDRDFVDNPEWFEFVRIAGMLMHKGRRKENKRLLQIDSEIKIEEMQDGEHRQNCQCAD